VPQGQAAVTQSGDFAASIVRPPVR
jgi:hypothetical protein